MSLRCLDKQILSDLKTEFFIETGTLNGDGIDYALELGFSNIISIDTMNDDDILMKFTSHKNVKLVRGDSGVVLWEQIKDLNQLLTFWLDAHADLIQYENKAWNPICPLLEELEQIKKHPIKNHPILIDDITPIIKIPGLTKAVIEARVMEINRDYRICYADTGGTQTLIASTNGKDYNSGLHAYR